jgi:hypothetical protein
MPVHRQALIRWQLSNLTMKLFFTFSLILITYCASAQLSFPKGFELIKGENLTGEDDVYSNGKYSFLVHEVFRAYDSYKDNDERFAKFVGNSFGFRFYLTKDGLCRGTGKVKGIYSYVVVTWDGVAIELSSVYKDTDFSNYSKWLLSTVRKYRKEGKPIMFPMHAP